MPSVPLPMVRLHADADPGDPPAITAHVQLSIARQPVQLEVSVTPGPTRITNLMPIFQGMAEIIVNIAENHVHNQELKISCKKGCGACCRQLVPISEMEARHLEALVQKMPEPRQTEIRRRFESARQRIVEADLESHLQTGGEPKQQQLVNIGLAYFHLGIPCPFLEEESCSIHLDRPLACREYLVTNSPEHCSKPTGETIRMVQLPVKISKVARLLERQAKGSTVQWMPLVTALAWVKENPSEPSPQPGPAMVQGFFKILAGEPVASPQASAGSDSP